MTLCTPGSERQWKSNEAFQILQTFTKIKCFNTDQCQVSTQGAYMTYVSHFDLNNYNGGYRQVSIRTDMYRFPNRFWANHDIPMYR